MATTTETHPERFYSLSIRNELGQDQPESKNYISGLMNISARRSINKNETPSEDYLSPEQSSLPKKYIVAPLSISITL